MCECVSVSVCVRACVRALLDSESRSEREGVEEE